MFKNKFTTAGRFLTNVALLSITSIVLRSISVWLSSYLSETLGAEILGLFTLTMSIYSLAVTVSTSAVGFATTRLVSEAMGGKKSGLIRQCMLRAILYSLVFGIGSGLLLYALASPIGLHILGDSRTVRGIRLLAISLPFVAPANALSGYFTAVRRVGRSSAVQILSNILKIALTVIFLEHFVPAGSEKAVSAIIAGAVIAEIFSLILSALLYIIDVRRYPKVSAVDGTVTKKLLSIALPIAFSSYLRSALTTIEHLLIPWGLRKYGKDSSYALSTYGCVQGMALPVVMFPYAVLSPFCSMLIPEISGLMASGQKDKIARSAERIIEIVLCFGIGTASCIILFCDDIGRVLFSNSEASLYIKLLAPLIPIMYLDTAVDSILKAINEQVYTMQVNIFDALMSVGIVFILLPKIGIIGFIIEIYFCEIVNFSLSLSRLITKSQVRAELIAHAVPMLAAGIFSTTLTKIILSLSGCSPITNSLILFTFIAICALIYISLYSIVKHLSERLVPHAIKC